MALVKIGLVQVPVTEDVDVNLRKAADMVREAAGNGARVVMLPEMFCCIYENASFVKNREAAGGRIWQALQKMAQENGIYLIGGSFPEADGEKIYNSCFIFDPVGKQIGRHRKMHLFDIDVEGGQHFHESDTFTPGDGVTVIDTEFGKIGVEICFDIRFVELTRLMALQGACMVFVPGAFNMTTGPLHWELHFRARALDNQIYMFGCAPARDEAGPYVSWGHSMGADPWGKVISSLDEKPGILMLEADTEQVNAVRQQLPIINCRRTDIYELRQKEQ